MLRLHILRKELFTTKNPFIFVIYSWYILRVPDAEKKGFFLNSKKNWKSVIRKDNRKLFQSLQKWGKKGQGFCIFTKLFRFTEEKKPNKLLSLAINRLQQVFQFANKLPSFTQGN